MHTLPATSIVCWGTGLQRGIPLRDQSGETLRNAYRNNWLRSYGRPRILVVDQQRSLCSGIFAESRMRWNTTRSDHLEAPWRNGKTERAGKDWKEDYYKTTQDGPEAQTWTDFGEDCDAVNQARASKINDSGNKQCISACFRQKSTTDGRCHFGVRRADEGVVNRQQAGELAQGTVDDYETPCPTGKSSLGPQTSLETSPSPRSETLQGRTACLTTPQVLATWSESSQENNKRVLAPGRGHQQHVGHSLDCLLLFRSQVCTIPGATVSRR